MNLLQRQKLTFTFSGELKSIQYSSRESNQSMLQNETLTAVFEIVLKCRGNNEHLEKNEILQVANQMDSTTKGAKKD